MQKLNYKATSGALIGNPAFCEASREELRVLLALIELDGKAESAEWLAKQAGISTARCRSSLAFWEEAGVISPISDTPFVKEEFPDRLVRGEIDEEPATKVAESIRDENLASMIDECAALLGQACLSNSDVKNLIGLATQYALSPEYIVTLAAYMVSKKKSTVKLICNEAIRLQGKGCDSVEALEGYIKNMEESSGTEWEFRRALGIYGRNLSQSEKKYFKKWSDEFGYSVNIVSIAYDIAVLNTGSGDLRYMDSVLTSWHQAGCKTVSECQSATEAGRAKKTVEGTAKKHQKTKPDTPRYGDFDIDEAFKNALARSYGED